MLVNRIIPCLDLLNGRVVKGINFENLEDIEEPTVAARTYSVAGADELVLLDISATHEQRKTVVETVRRVVREITIPLTVGGGISTIEDIEKILNIGAEKISINSAAVRDETLISRAAKMFGSRRVVVAIDVKYVSKKLCVFTSGGRIDTGMDGAEWAERVQNLGAGEILLTSMDTDGTRNGYDLDAINTVCKNISIPVIASGGAGCMEHFYDVFTKTKASGALAASLFHYRELEIGKLKQYLADKGIPIKMDGISKD